MRVVMAAIDVALAKRRMGIGIALALAAIVGAVGFANDFVYDDVPIIRDNALIHSLAGWQSVVASTWWPAPFVQQLYRPLALLMLAAQYAVGDGAPIVFRVASCVLYVAGVYAVWRLASRLFAERVAAIVAILFAVHPVHVEAVAQAVNQGELVVGLAAALMVTLYVDRRRAGTLRARDWYVLALLYMVAFLAKESGYMLPGLLLAAEFTILADARTPRPQGMVAGYVALTVVAACGLLARHAVLAGYGFDVRPVADLRDLTLGQRVYTMLQVVPEWLRLLVFPARLQADYAPNAFPMPTVFGAAEAFGLLIVAAVPVFAWRTRRTASVVAFGLVWCVVTLFPVSNIVPTGIMLAERTLYVPSIGFLIGVASVAERAVAHSRHGARLRTAIATACVVAAVLGLARSANRMSLWNSAHIEVTGTARAAR